MKAFFLILSLMRTFSSLSANGFLSSKKRDQRVSENILVQQLTTLLKKNRAFEEQFYF